MKRTITAFLFVLLSFGVFAQAQGSRRGNSNEIPVEKRVEMTMKKLSDLNLTAEQKLKLEKTFTAFFEGVEGMQKNLADRRELTMAAVEKRDKEVKNILSDAQFTQYKAMMEKGQQRGGGKGGRRRG